MLAPLKNQNPVRGGDCGEIAGRLWGDCQEIGGEIEGRLREIAGRLWGAIERGDCVEIAGDCGEIDVVFSSGNSGMVILQNPISRNEVSVQCTPLFDSVCTAALKNRKQKTGRRFSVLCRPAAQPEN